MKFGSRRRRTARLAQATLRAWQIEALEDRSLLSASPVFVNDNWQLAVDNGPAGVSSGDTVSGAFETLGSPPITATFGTNGFGSVLQVKETFPVASDALWTRYTPTGGASFSNPNSSQGTFGYRIQATASGNPQVVGPGRAGSTLSPTFNDFRVSVDLVNWNDALDQAFGLLGRVSNVGLGTTNGYTLNYVNQDHQLQLNRISGEVPTQIGTAAVTLDPLNDYTLVFTGIGSSLGAQVFLAGSTTPLVSISATDATYSSGKVGLFIYDATTNANGAADATFDNFYAYGGVTAINSAIANTTPGGITNILEGTYSENVVLATNVTLAGTGTINGSFTATGAGAIVSPGTGSGAGQFHTGNLTLGAGSTLQIGLIAPVLIDNFNAARAWPVGFATEYGTYDSFDGQVVQDGGGTLVIGGAANEQGGLYRDRGGDTLYNLTGRTQIEVTAKISLDNAADTFIVAMADADGTEFYYSFATSGLNNATFTTLAHDLSKPDSIPSAGDDGMLDLANIVSFNIRGDYSSNAALRLVLDNLQVGGQDQLDVTGTVNLSAAALAGSVLGFTPATGQQFVIINNDGNDPVSGTFTGYAEGATVSLGGTAFSITYAGGTGANDVVLTALAPSTSIAGRRLFYNNSGFDGNNPAAGAADDGAIASDKAALLPGQTATFANVSSYSRGINGVVLDIQGLSGTPSASDFIFRTGNDNTPSGWATAADPTISVRAGAGANGSARVTFTWPDGTIKNTWLQITAKTSLGLSSADVFYFGSAVGESGNLPTTSFQVNSSDEIGARNNPKTFVNPALITDAYDFNRDGYVNATDQILARSNSTTVNTDLNVITVPAAIGEQSIPAAALAASASPVQATAVASTQPATQASSSTSAPIKDAVDQICAAIAAAATEQRSAVRRALHTLQTQFADHREEIESGLLSLLANRKG